MFVLSNYMQQIINNQDFKVHEKINILFKKCTCMQKLNGDLDFKQNFMEQIEVKLQTKMESKRKFTPTFREVL